MKKESKMLKRETDFIKYPKIHRVGHAETEELFLDPNCEIILQEKADGSCNCCYWDSKQNQLLFSSRNRVLATEKDLHQFKYGIDFIKEIIGDGSILNKSLIYYFENMITHTISYDKSITPPAIGFDIRVKKSKGKEGPGLFLDYDAQVKEFKRVGIPIVKLIKKCKLKDLGKIETFDKLVPKSVYYAGEAEGVILKCYVRLDSYGNQMFAKVVTEDFKELNRATFGNVKRIKSDSSKLVEELATDARIRKIIFKLVEEDGHTLENELMRFLPVQVIDDIFQEELKYILKNYKTINIPSLKKHIAKKCFNILSFVKKEKEE